MPQVKVFFEAEKEIRRYLLPSSGAFDDLMSKIRAVLGDGVNFRLFWKDVEGDFVVFESDLELQTALDFVATSGNQSDLLRIYVRNITNAAPATPRPPAPVATSVFDEVTIEDDMETDQERPVTAEKKEPEVRKEEQKAPEAKTEEKNEKTDEPAGPKEHVGISCDGCGNQVIGTRFKCTKCPDYDLCETCKGKGYHLEHELEAITEPRPRAAEFSNFPWMNMDFGAGGCQRGGPRFNGRCRFPGMQAFVRHHGPGGAYAHGSASAGSTPADGSAGSGTYASGSASAGSGSASAGSASAGSGPGGFCGAQFRQPHNMQLPKTVDEIAQSLKDMGITADGGVIRELIEQFHGDIVKIIEAMN